MAPCREEDCNIDVCFMVPWMPRFLSGYSFMVLSFVSCYFGADYTNRIDPLGERSQRMGHRSLIARESILCTYFRSRVRCCNGMKLVRFRDLLLIPTPSRSPANLSSLRGFPVRGKSRFSGVFAQLNCSLIFLS